MVQRLRRPSDAMTDHPIAQLAYWLARISADILAAGTVVAAWLGFLPPVVSLLALAWYGVLFFDRFKTKK